MKRFVGYLRVSTERQGRSGLGLAAQRDAVLAYVGKGTLTAEFVEVESGRKADRPQLDAALRHCRATGAVLVVAKLDRLARDVRFLSTLMDAGADFIALDLPEANRLTLHIMAAVAEHEARIASERTRAAMQAAKARGQRMGNPNGAAPLRRADKGNTAAMAAIKAKAKAQAENLRDMVRDIQGAGITSLSGIAAELTRRGAKTPRGGNWHAGTVARLLRRLDT